MNASPVSVVVPAFNAQATIRQTIQAILNQAQWLRHSLAEIATHYKIDIPSDESPIIPIVIGDNKKAIALAKALQNQGLDIRAIRPPTVPEGTARLRLTVTWPIIPSSYQFLLKTWADILNHH